MPSIEGAPVPAEDKESLLPLEDSENQTPEQQEIYRLNAERPDLLKKYVELGNEYEAYGKGGMQAEAQDFTGELLRQVREEIRKGGYEVPNSDALDELLKRNAENTEGNKAAT